MLICVGTVQAKGVVLADKKESRETLAVYLTEESKAGLTSYLQKKGVVGAEWIPPSQVALKSRIDEMDHYVYSPIYGERAAFRLKGTLTSRKGSEIVGIGRVSNMSGELFDDDFEASVVLKAEGNSPERVQAMVDMPTLLFKSLTAASQWGDEAVLKWKGPVPGGEVLGETYGPTAEVAMEKFKPDIQLVIDGHICSSKYIDEKGACTFDKADIPDKVPEEAMKRRGLIEEREQEQEQQSQGENDGEECSVCRFMKRGPCGSEFKEWDGCVQRLKEGEDLKKCFGLTVAMMNCMKKHEYYDIMTANSEAKMEQMSATTETTTASAE